MRRIFSPNLLWVCVALLGAIFLGVLAGVVSDRRVLAVIVSSFCLLMIVLISKRLKFGLLALSIPLSLLQIPTLPTLGFSLSEIILIALTADELLRASSGHGMNGKPLKPGVLISFGLFAFAGLVTALVSGGLNAWHRYCLMPILWFFLSSRKIRDLKDAWLLVKLSLMTIVVFFAISAWANATGHFENYFANASSYSQGRLGFGQLVRIGPIQFRVGSVDSGTIAALGFPACILLWIEKKGERWWRMGVLLILAGFGYVLILSAARGAIVGAIAGSFLTILASRKFLSPKLLGAFALLLVVFAIWGTAFLELFPEQNILRIQTILHGMQDSNFQIRKDALELAWKLTLQNPLGVGFGYLWNTYGIDDSIIYACILEATGILGSIAFLMIVVQLAFEFVLIIIKSSVKFIRDFASLGLGTLIVGLVAGISSQSVLFEPVQSFVFWAIIMATYHGVKSQD